MPGKVVLCPLLSTPPSSRFQVFWYSRLSSTEEFIRAAKRDRDLVFVARRNGANFITLSGALELDDRMVVLGGVRLWRVHISAKGKNIRAVPIQGPLGGTRRIHA